MSENTESIHEGSKQTENQVSKKVLEAKILTYHHCRSSIRYSVAASLITIPLGLGSANKIESGIALGIGAGMNLGSIITSLYLRRKQTKLIAEYEKTYGSYDYVRQIYLAENAGN